MGSVTGVNGVVSEPVFERVRYQMPAILIFLIVKISMAGRPKDGKVWQAGIYTP